MREEGRLATHTGSKHPGHFYFSICEQHQLKMKVLPTAVLGPIRNICILLLLSSHIPAPKGKVHLQGSIPSTDNNIK